MRGKIIVISKTETEGDVSNSNTSETAAGVTESDTTNTNADARVLSIGSILDQILFMLSCIHIPQPNIWANRTGECAAIWVERDTVDFECCISCGRFHVLSCIHIPQNKCAAPTTTCEGAIRAKCDASAQPFMPCDCVQRQSRNIPQKEFFPTPTGEPLPTWAECDLPHRPRMPSEPLLVLSCVRIP